MIKPASPPALPLEIQANLEKLSQASKLLNEVSDKFTKEVSVIEATINKFNLGVDAWVVFDSWTDQEEMETGYWSLGYGKLQGKWGLLIAYSREDRKYGPDADSFEQWLFKDSPRDKRLQAVDVIPKLLEALIKKSGEVATEIKLRTDYVQKLALSFSFGALDLKKKEPK